MARIPLSKSQLTREKEGLASYQRFLPALDLKRQQLMTERARARRNIAELRDKLAAMPAEVGEAIPMLADRRIELSGLARVKAVKLGTQNVTGVRLPVVEDVEIERTTYGYMVRPHWVDALIDRLETALKLRVEVEIAERRLAVLERAVVRVTQRVNLFDKVLIPQARENIRRINVYLGDAERAAVVGAKIAKRKRETQVTS
ncbi:V-type ATP synthase subunit D [Methyloceanibacter sp.]|uniref:V-type ATP synthase subunit D n=1 Tax=Methyloceanibacter sp. TaxID=1965321 RepID=UPI00207F97D6|nr:V-type ATP synthase subunit D [Methyloceanibacter sp.]GFO82561.1 MAG: ATP synthase subunit D [Methyloceanibacter sp.]HML90807.1 V-type ATP synthase subunit D [Methyloceanibacter sp.]